MKTGILCVAAVFAVPLLSVSALADQPEGEPTEQAKPQDSETSEAAATKDQPDTIEIPEVKEQEERICRRVKLDMSSRRATKVCKTSEEWREFNQRR